MLTLEESRPEYWLFSRFFAETTTLSDPHVTFPLEFQKKLLTIRRSKIELSFEPLHAFLALVGSEESLAALGLYGDSTLKVLPLEIDIFPLKF